MLVRELTEGDKREICGWDYQGEYAIYNLPSYEEMEAKEQGFLNPRQEKNYRGFFEDDTLVGFVNLLEETHGDLSRGGSLPGALREGLWAGNRPAGLWAFQGAAPHQAPLPRGSVLEYPGHPVL